MQEPLATVAALIGFFPRVTAQVNPQFSEVGKAFAAFCAAVRLVRDVNQLVLRETVCPGKLFATLIALVELSPRVRVLVVSFGMGHVVVCFMEVLLVLFQSCRFEQAPSTEGTKRELACV